MKLVFYVPIFEWNGVDGEADHGTSFGTTLYTSLDDLYMFNGEDAIGHFEVEGDVPSENQFRRKHNLHSGAV